VQFKLLEVYVFLMWILGHLALGYISALLVSRYTGEKVIIPLVLLVSLLPDLDRFFEGILVHRGPTHSIIVAIALFMPIFLLFRNGFVYFSALASHTLIGDYFVTGNPYEQLFWPVSNNWIGAPSYLQLSGRFETMVEVALFFVMLFLIVRSWRS